MKKQDPSNASELSKERHSVSVLVRLVVEPAGGGDDPRLRVDALELNDTQRRNFGSIPSALAWLGEVLESRAEGWGLDRGGPGGPYEESSRTP